MEEDTLEICGGASKVFSNKMNPKNGVLFRSLSILSIESLFTFHDANADSFEVYNGRNMVNFGTMKELKQMKPISSSGQRSLRM